MNNTTIAEQWSQYASTWSSSESDRLAILARYVSTDVVYSDPTIRTGGLQELIQYMAEFQRLFPGGSFRTDALFAHHDRILADWSLIGPRGESVQNGTTIAELDTEQRLAIITAFPRP